MEHIVGIGGYAVSNTPGDVIKTFALSTCVGVVFYSARRRAMGMAHVQLPDSRSAHGGSEPGRYADTAPRFLLQQLQTRFGLTKGELKISLYGGIDRMGDNDCFNIGEKNLAVLKAALRDIGLACSEADTGGFVSRTLAAYVGTGVVEVVRRPMAMGAEDAFKFHA